MTTYLIVVEGLGETEFGDYELNISCVNSNLPGNSCETAIEIECGEVFSGDTTEYDDTGGLVDSKDLWFTFDATSIAGYVVVSLCEGTDFDSLIVVYDSCGGNIVADNDDFCDVQSQTLFFADGEIYTILVEGFAAKEFGEFSLSVTCLPDDIGENDFCEDATPLTCGDFTIGFTDEVGDTGGANTSSDLWYTYTGTGTEEDVTVSTCTDPSGSGGTEMNTLITVYDACGGNVIASNDDFCDLRSQVTFASDGTSTYHIVVEGSDGSIDGFFYLYTECEETLGINEENIGDISFYPNPAKDIINVKASETLQKVEIYTLLGQKAIEKDIDTKELELNISELSSGTYLMKVYANNQFNIYNLIKE